MSSNNSFPSYIQVNRYIDRNIFFKDSKLYTLLTYCALSTKRAEYHNLYGPKLEVGQFLIGRKSVVDSTDLSETEYRTRIKRLEDIKIIEKVKVTNQYTIYKWLDNPFISVNLDHSTSHNTQQDSEGVTTTNNINNNLISVNSSYLSFYNNNIINILNKPILLIVVNYLVIKGLDKNGPELIKDIITAKKILDAQRTSKEAKSLMEWFENKVKNDIENYTWVKNWTLETVEKKLPEFLAGKLEIDDFRDDITLGGRYEEIKL